MDYYKESLKLHKKYKGKIEIQSKIRVETQEDLSLVYSPGVAEPCKAIAENIEKVYDYTIKGNTVAVITDGSAVLGLGNIGAAASIPVMEGKAMLFKKFAGIDAFPICLDTQDTDEINQTVRIIAPIFEGINVEDISALRSFIIEKNLQDLGIPVFHDDQHGYAIVVLAGLINAAKLVKKNIFNLNVVISGAGAAGIAIARLLRCVDHKNDACISVGQIVICDSKGAIHKGRTDLNDAKKEILKYSNPNNVEGSIQEVTKGADVFIGVSVGNLISSEDVSNMAKDAIIFALANPTPEIMPDEAKKGGAVIIGTGRSDFPNQVNNGLGFTGIFRGALDAKAKVIFSGMRLAAAFAIVDSIDDPDFEHTIPSSLSKRVFQKVAEIVKETALKK